jgi:hypothetical protein
MSYPRQSRLVAVIVIAVVGLLGAGCAKTAAGEGSLGNQDAQPARLVAVPGTNLHRVILTPAAQKQVGIKTVAVAAAPTAAVPTTTAAAAPTPAPTPAPAATPAATPAAAAMEVIPVTAVIYDPSGASWTYTIPGVRTYLRVPVTVDHIDGNEAYLSAGPPVGTLVVTQGAPELLGAEYGVGEE